MLINWDRHWLPKRFGITLEGTQEVRRSAQAGKEIFVGLYPNANLEMASVLHEIGHTRFSSSKYQEGKPFRFYSTYRLYEEFWAWEWALRINQKAHLFLPEEASWFIKDCLFSYLKDFRGPDENGERVITSRLEMEDRFRRTFPLLKSLGI